LHIVKKYAEMMHGTIMFKSKLEQGTEFIIDFKRINEMKNEV